MDPWYQLKKGSALLCPISFLSMGRENYENNIGGTVRRTLFLKIML